MFIIMKKGNSEANKGCSVAKDFCIFIEWSSRADVILSLFNLS